MSSPNDDAARLAEIRSRCDKAKPGPWMHGDGCCGPYVSWQAHGDERAGLEPLSDYDGSEAVWLGGSVEEDDRAFIAHSREDIPWLLSLLDAQQAEVERLRRGLDRFADHKSYCDGMADGHFDPPCTCGLSAVLKGDSQ